jgi:Fe-S cluster assembly iron-binding protein IscA
VKVFVDPKAIFYVVGTSVRTQREQQHGDTTRGPSTVMRSPRLVASLLFCVDSTMDYVDSDVASEFVFKNPNSKGSCGCGESFNV